MDATTIAAIAGFARPVLAALFTLLAAAGVLHGTNDAVLDAAATLVGALGAAGMALWGWLHARKVVPAAQAQRAAALAYVAASQDGVTPQSDPDHLAVQAAARNALAGARP